VKTWLLRRVSTGGHYDQLLKELAKVPTRVFRELIPANRLNCNVLMLGLQKWVIKN